MSVNLNCMLLILHISGIMPTTKASLQSDPSDWGIIRAQSTVCTQHTCLVVDSELTGCNTWWKCPSSDSQALHRRVSSRLPGWARTLGFHPQLNTVRQVKNKLAGRKWSSVLDCLWGGNSTSEELFWGIIKLLRNHSGLYEARAACGSVLFTNRDI